MRRPIKYRRETKEAPQRVSQVHKIDHAATLQSQLEAPIYNRLIDRWVGQGELSYELYLKTRELLSLQNRSDDLVTHDELMFQVVHQTQELWLKLLAHESVELVRRIDSDELCEASTTLERMVRVALAMKTDIRVLDTLLPQRFLTIRRHLGDGSGQQSPGFNQLILAATGILEALQRLLSRRTVELQQVYAEQSPHAEVQRLCEQLVDLDEAYQQWLVAHFHLVRRTMGVDRKVRALDGLPSRVLLGRMTKPLFEALWEVRVAMTQEWTTGGGHAPGMPRRSGEAD